MTQYLLQRLSPTRRSAKRIAMALFAVLATATAHSALVTPSEALARAMANGPLKAAGSQSTAPQLVYTATAADGLDGYYVFTSAPSGGYMILPADDDAAPMLGYVDSGNFDIDAIPANMRTWLDGYADQIAWMRSHPATAEAGSAVVATVAAPARKPIAPMLTTRWNQDEPYNLLCPKSEQFDATCAAGCVATAMAQIMKFHEWPAVGIGSNSYNWKYIYNGISCEGSDALDFSSISFDWDNMLDIYTSESTDEQRTAVATLVHACGVAVNMNYTPSMSGASMYDALTGLCNYFDYPSASLRPRDYYNSSEWEEMVYGELAAGRPVFYDGNSQGSGHAFVCDGYSDDGYFHINWGWGGSSDGYFLLTVLNPPTLGIGGGSQSGFNFNQNVIINIAPSTAQLEQDRYFVASGGLSTDNTSYSTQSSNISFYPNTNGQQDELTLFVNYSPVTVKGFFGIRIIGEDKDVYTKNESKNNRSVELNPFWGMRSFAVRPSDILGSVGNGSYVVTPAFYDEDADRWYDVDMPVSANQYLAMTVADSEITFEMPTASPSISISSVVPVTGIASGMQFTMDVTLNNSGTTYYGPLTAMFMADVEPTTAYAATTVAVEVPAGSTIDYAYTAALDDVQPGNYSVVFVDAAKQVISEPVEVYVDKAGTLSLNAVTLNAYEEKYIFNPIFKMYGDYGVVHCDDLQFTVNLSATGGLYNGPISAAIFDTGNEYKYVGEYSSNAAYIADGETKDVVISGSLTEGIIGNLYIAQLYDCQNNLLGREAGIFPFFVLGESSVVPTGIDEVGVTGTDAALAIVGNTLAIAAADAIAQVDIYSISGMTMLTQRGDGSNSASVDISRLAPGHYVVAVATANGPIVRKFVK